MRARASPCPRPEPPQARLGGSRSLGGHEIGLWTEGSSARQGRAVDGANASRPLRVLLVLASRRSRTDSVRRELTPRRHARSSRARARVSGRNAGATTAPRLFADRSTADAGRYVDLRHGLRARETARGSAPWSAPPMCGGGDEGSRTLDLRIANASLYQLSYVPTWGEDPSGEGARMEARQRSAALIDVRNEPWNRWPPSATTCSSRRSTVAPRARPETPRPRHQRPRTSATTPSAHRPPSTRARLPPPSGAHRAIDRAQRGRSRGARDRLRRPCARRFEAALGPAPWKVPRAGGSSRESVVALAPGVERSERPPVQRTQHGARLVELESCRPRTFHPCGSRGPARSSRLRSPRTVPFEGPRGCDHTRASKVPRSTPTLQVVGRTSLPLHCPMPDASARPVPGRLSVDLSTLPRPPRRARAAGAACRAVSA